MKQSITRITRNLGLIPALDLLRFRISYLKNYPKNRQFKKQQPAFIFPEPYMVYETFKMDYEGYHTSGKETAAWIIQELSENISLENAHILDWGCGPGRVIRHLQSVCANQVNLYGSDYNPAYVSWCKKILQQIHFEKNELNPPLAFTANFFDAVYALSIFTHLSLEAHQHWTREIFRVLKPGGVFLFTTHGDVTTANLLDDEIEVYSTGKLVERAKVKEGHRMFVAYHPIPFIKTLIAPFGEVIKHIPGDLQPWGPRQDTWLVRKFSR